MTTTEIGESVSRRLAGLLPAAMLRPSIRRSPMTRRRKSLPRPWTSPRKELMRTNSVTNFPHVELVRCSPGGPHRAEIIDGIRTWVHSEALGALLDGFDVPLPQGSLPNRIAELVEASAVWDYRQGGERSTIRPVSYGPELGDLIDAAVTALGLATNGSPGLDGYDHMLVLGGGPKTARARPSFAASLAAKDVTVSHIAGLSSLRPLTAVAPEATRASLAPQAATEADVMAEGMKEAFSAHELACEKDGLTSEGAPWWVRRYETSEVGIHVIAAPTSDVRRRANTADTLAGWAEFVKAPGQNDRILIVTTDLFVPFQHYDAVRILGLRYGCGVETVGLDPRNYSQWLKGSKQTEVLQEVRSAILALGQLFAAVA
jgi:hypothetical protein